MGENERTAAGNGHIANDVNTPLVNGNIKNEGVYMETTEEIPAKTSSNQPQPSTSLGKDTGNSTDRQMSSRESGRRVVDGGWGWMVVLGTAIAHVVYGILVRAFGIIYLEMLDKYNQTPTATSWIGALNITATGLFGPVASMLCQKFSCRSVTIVGALIMALGVVTTGYAPNVETCYITFGIIAGFGTSLTYTPGYIMVGEYFEKRKGLAMSLATFGSGFGALVFPPVILLLFEELSYSGAFLIIGSLCLHCLISGALFRPNKRELPSPASDVTVVEPNEMESQSNFRRSMKSLSKSMDSIVLLTDTKLADVGSPFADDEEEDEGFTELPLAENGHTTEKKDSPKSALNAVVKESHDASVAMKKPAKAPLCDFSLLRKMKFWGLLGIIMSNSITLGLSSGFLPALGVENGFGRPEAAFLLSMSGIGTTVGVLGLGFLFDISIVRKYRLHIYNVFVLIVGIFTILNPLTRNYWLFSFMTFIRGLGAGIIQSQRATMAVDIVGGKRAANAVGLLLFFTAIGSLIGRVSGGALKDVLHSYSWSFYFSGAINIVSFLIFFIILVVRSKK